MGNIGENKKKTDQKKKAAAKKKETKKPEEPKEIVLTGKDKERYHTLLEELEAVCRHYAEVDAEKKEVMARFKEELDAISKRKEGILKDIDNLKKPLPLFDTPGPPVKFCKWAGCKDAQGAGSDYCKKHDEESRKLREKNSKTKKPKKKATPKKKK